MAKKTALQIFNGVLHNMGLPEVTVLTSMDAFNLVVWDKIQESIIEIANMPVRWQPLMGTGTATMTTGTNSFAAPTDLLQEVIDSFRVPDNTDVLEFKTEQEWDADYPDGIQATDTGWPGKIKRRLADNMYELDKYPTATQNGKKVYYRYKKMPVLLSTATTTGTCWIPEQYDDLVLVNLATYKMMMYRGLANEARDYWMRLFVDTPTYDCYLTQMKSIYAAIPQVRKIRVTNIF